MCCSQKNCSRRIYNYSRKLYFFLLLWACFFYIWAPPSSSKYPRHPQSPRKAQPGEFPGTLAEWNIHRLLIDCGWFLDMHAYVVIAWGECGWENAFCYSVHWNGQLGFFSLQNLWCSLSINVRFCSFGVLEMHISFLLFNTWYSKRIRVLNLLHKLKKSHYAVH